MFSLAPLHWGSYLFYNKPGPLSVLLCNLLHLNSLGELLAKRQMCLRGGNVLRWGMAVKRNRNREKQRSLPGRRHLEWGRRWTLFLSDPHWPAWTPALSEWWAHRHQNGPVGKIYTLKLHLIKGLYFISCPVYVAQHSALCRSKSGVSKIHLCMFLKEFSSRLHFFIKKNLNCEIIKILRNGFVF